MWQVFSRHLGRSKGRDFKAAALIDLSTVADIEISNPPWVKFQSAGWVNFPSAPTGHAKQARGQAARLFFTAHRQPYVSGARVLTGQRPSGFAMADQADLHAEHPAKTVRWNNLAMPVQNPAVHARYGPAPAERR